MRIPIAAEGYPFILGFVLLAVVVRYFTGGWPFYIALLVALFVVAFFRDPERVIPPDPNVIVSPADGKVIKVDRLRDTRFLDEEVLRVSVFMNLFDVHVNRAPVSGRVEKLLYNPGRFFAANLDKASLENEQNAIFIDSPKGTVVMNQIAGLVARRIVCRVGVGDTVEKGARVGLIRFGSRVDLYLPLASKISVEVGDRVKAGSSVIGTL